MEKKRLTSSQNDFLTYLNAIKDKNTNSVQKKYAEIASERFCSVAAVNWGVKHLEQKGWVKREWEGAGKNPDGSPRIMTIKII